MKFLSQKIIISIVEDIEFREIGKSEQVNKTAVSISRY